MPSEASARVSSQLPAEFTCHPRRYPVHGAEECDARSATIAEVRARLALRP